MELLCWAMASSRLKPIFRRSHSKTCTPCLHTSRTSFDHPEFCYAMSMVCAMLACYVLDSSESKHGWPIFIRPGRAVGEVALDQADLTIMQGYLC
jgi:hypothetical protein